MLKKCVANPSKNIFGDFFLAKSFIVEKNA